MFRIFVAVFLLVGARSWAADLEIELKTPRNTTIKLDVYNPGFSSAVLLGPGQGCNPRTDLYEALAREAGSAGYTLVRVYWAYCLTKPQGNASKNLLAEVEDFQTALGYMINDLRVQVPNIVVGGKSLGSFVSSEVFRHEPGFSGLILLTPVCTSSSGKNIFAQNYPSLSSETRTVLLVQGNTDDICSVHHFQEYLKDKPTNFISLVTNGDHGLSIENSSGELDSALRAKNLRAVARWIFSWIQVASGN